MLSSYLENLLSVFKNQGVPSIVLVLIIVLILAHLYYLLRGYQVRSYLKKIVKNIYGRKNEAINDPKSLDKYFSGDKDVQHLWSEYCETLHAVKQATEQGDEKKFRATVSSEHFFTRQTLVDMKLNEDFFKHLPGLLTGLGIVATFGGLLKGLGVVDFRNATTSAASMKPLIDGVIEAFFVSGTAIAVAMIVVFSARIMITTLYKQVEILVQKVDSFYDSGLGEDYLSRLVDASEQNSQQTAALKDALIEDFREIMTELTERQISATNESMSNLGQGIADKIGNALQEPLKQAQEVMNRASETSSEQVGNMLEHTTNAFLERLEDTFGKQIESINQKLDQTGQTILTVKDNLETFIEQIKTTTKESSKEMTAVIAKSMEEFAKNQSTLMENFRSEMKASLEQMNEQRKIVAQEEEKRIKSLTDSTSSVVQELSVGVEDLLASLNKQLDASQENISKLQNVVTTSIKDLSDSAILIDGAAEKFGKAGQSVNEIMDQSKTLSTTMNQTSENMNQASNTLNEGFQKYEDSRKQVDENISVLNQLVENAKKEAGLSKTMIDDMALAVEKLKEAQTKSRENIEEINIKTEKAFEQFGNGLVTQVRKISTEYDSLMGQGMGNIRGVIDQFRALLDELENRQ